MNARTFLRFLTTVFAFFAAVTAFSNANSAEPYTPKPRPPLNPSEYTRYLGSGTSSLYLPSTFVMPDGSVIPCTTGNYDKAYLYPDTEFTRWIIEEWIALLQHGRKTIVSAYPGSPHWMGLPTYLNPIPFSDEPKAVRTAYCDRAHRFVFRNLPIGRYAIVAEHENGVERYHQRLVFNQIDTPDGPQIQASDGGVESDGYLTDGFLFYTPKDIYIEKANFKYTMPSDTLETVVHYRMR